METIINNKNNCRLYNARKYSLLFFIIPLLAIINLIKNPFYQDVIAMVLFYASLASAWNIIGGFAGQISLGHAVYFGIGAYTSTLLYIHLGLSPWVGMFFGAILAIILGLLIGFPTFKLKSHFFALATIASSEVVRLLAFYWRDLTRGGVGILIPFKPGFSNFMFEGKLSYIYLFLFLMIISVLISQSIKKSHFGYYLFAIKNDQDAAESLGVNTTKYKLQAMTASVFLTSLAGTFYVQYVLFFDPDSVFSTAMSQKMALICIIGGIGLVSGPIIGAFLLIPLEILLRGWLGPIFSGLNIVIYGVILIIVAIYFPRGIAGGIENYYRSKRRKKNFENVTTIPKKKLKTLETENIFNNGVNYLSKSDSTILEVKGLTKSFGGLTAVKNVDFQVKKGEIVGLIGPNGAGKTTIFNLLSGFISPDFGEIIFKGENISGIKYPHIICKRGLVRTFQIVKPFHNMSVIENVMVAAFNRTKNVEKARNIAKTLLDFCDLLEHQDNLSGEINLANQKKLELCKALATGSELILLDEVMAGLNPKETNEIIEIIRKISNEGFTLLIIEHIMQAIMSLSQRIIVLNTGEKIAEGKPKEISENEKVIKAYLGEKYVTKSK